MSLNFTGNGTIAFPFPLADNNGRGSHLIQVDFGAGVTGGTVTLRGRVSPDCAFLPLGTALSGSALVPVIPVTELEVQVTGFTGTGRIAVRVRE
jgi:hypothetical protein